MAHMLAATLPDWITTDRLKVIAIGVIVAFVVIELLIARFVGQLVVKGLMLALIAGLGVAVWVQRSNLETCAKTCECRFFGQEVQLPDPARQVCNPANSSS